MSPNEAQVGTGGVCAYAAVINGLHFPNRSVLHCGTRRRRAEGGVWVTGAERRALSLSPGTRGDNTGSLVSVRNMTIFSSLSVGM